MPEIHAYPLSWPVGWKRTPAHQRRRGRFSRAEPTFCGDHLYQQRKPDDPGVAAYWRRPGEPQRCMAIDRYDDVADNLAAIAATLEAMRSIERHGGAEILDRAFTGFAALPAPDARAPWRIVLGFIASERPTVEQVRDRYRSLRSMHHPDRGGDAAKFTAVQRAYEDALAEISGVA